MPNQAENSGGGTLIEVEHRNLPAEHLPSHGVGWPMFLERLGGVAVP